MGLTNIDNPLTEIGDRKKMAFLHKHGFSFEDIGRLFNINSAKVQTYVSFENSREKSFLEELVEKEQEKAKPLSPAQKALIDNFLSKTTGKHAGGDFIVCNLNKNKEAEAAFEVWQRGLLVKWQTARRSEL